MRPTLAGEAKAAQDAGGARVNRLLFPFTGDLLPVQRRDGREGRRELRQRDAYATIHSLSVPLERYNRTKQAQTPSPMPIDRHIAPPSIRSNHSFLAFEELRR